VTATAALGDLRAADEPRFGGKSAALGELIAAGLPVPSGFALSMSAMSTDVRDEVAERYRELGEPPVAVRSSALGEDSSEATFAGQQETVLWVRGAAAVYDAVERCWASLYSAEAVSYREHLGQTEAAMGVTIQQMVDAAVAGVLFTCNPVSGDPSMVAINASWGLGLAVVAGEVTPDDWLVSKVTGEVVRESINAKEIEYEVGAVKVDVPPERQSVACLDAQQLRALVELGKQAERHFGSHQDVEWAFDRDGELFVLQSRPVTALHRKEAPKGSAISMVMGMFGVDDATE